MGLCRHRDAVDAAGAPRNLHSHLAKTPSPLSPAIGQRRSRHRAGPADGVRALLRPGELWQQDRLSTRSADHADRRRPRLVAKSPARAEASLSTPATMAQPRPADPVLLVVALFSRHVEALSWGRERL